MRTGQSAHMRLASRDDPPFSRKKRSGPSPRQRARSCHGTKWCTATPRNYILVILRETATETQVLGKNFLISFAPLHIYSESWRTTALRARDSRDFLIVKRLYRFGKAS